MNFNLTLIMQAVAFGLFIWFCAKFVWPPLMRAIETRQKQIADGLAAGEQGRKDLASAEKRASEVIAEAKAKSAEIVAIGEKFKTDTIEQAKIDARTEAERIIAAAKEVQLKVPLVVRLEGTNVEKGKELLRNSGLAITPADNLRQAAEKAVAALK